jgi:hypothetical protein
MPAFGGMIKFTSRGVLMNWLSARVGMVLVVVTLMAGCSMDVQPEPDPLPEPSLSLPEPSVTQVPEPPELPIPVASGDVIGGGPSEDAEAVARINLLLNDIPGDYQVTGQDALAYANELSALFPTLGPAFDKVSVATDCAFTSGVIGAKAYLAPDLRHAGATVIVSGKQLQNLGAIALDCIVREVLGESLPFGGGEEGFDPCFDSYQLDAVINGVTDRYYVFTAGTNPETCQYLRSAHEYQTLKPTPIG